MHRIQFLLIFTFFWSAVLITGCQTSTPSEPNSPAVSQPTRGLDELLDAVVRIDVREVSFEGGGNRRLRGVGSGVILSPEGHVLTNAHVVSPEAEEILVTLANLERVEAQLIGWDHWTDLALLQLEMEDIQRRGLDFRFAQFGDSASLRAGQTVYAVGTPNGLTRTVTKGIISNPQRYFAANSEIRGFETGYFNSWLQTDAAINPGNSGGPLVDEEGRVVGINTRSYLGANNLSFAVPSLTAESVMQALRRDGEMRRSYIGIRLAPMRDLEAFFGLESNEGALIDSVDPGSPAASANLRAGDIIHAINDQPVDGRFPEQLPGILNRIAESPIGESLRLDIQRGSDRWTAQVTTEVLESRVGERRSFDAWGMSVQRVSRAFARERRYESSDGVIVIGLQSAFPAEQAGLRRGDVILSANREPIRSMDDLDGLYQSFEEEPDRVLLEVLRDREASFYVLKP